MDLVGTGAHGEVDDGAAEHSELGAGIAGLNLELLDRLDRGRNADPSVHRFRIADPIDREPVPGGGYPIDAGVDRGARTGSRPRFRIAAALARGQGPGHQLH